jgi:hypothetical protein
VERRRRFATAASGACSLQTQSPYFAIRKHRLAFRNADGNQRAIEFLGDGQQVIIEGPHAKGANALLRDGIGLIEARGPWLQTNPANVVSSGEARMGAKWKAFCDSQLGADYVYQSAAKFGFMDGVEASARDIFGA